MKKKNNPRVESNIDINRLNEITDGSITFTDIFLNKDIFLKYIAINKYGIYVFIPVKEIVGKELFKKAAYIRNYFNVSMDDLYIFIFKEDVDDTKEGNLLNYKENILYPMDDFYTQFENLYINLLRPYVDRIFINKNNKQALLEEPEVPEEYKADNSTNGKCFEVDGIIYEIHDREDIVDTGELNYSKENISENKVYEIAYKCGRLENKDCPKDDYKVADDGTEYILRHAPVHVFGLDTGLVSKKEWYKVASISPDKLFLSTVFGGCFGIHKFMVGHIFEGILYLLTCGCFGMLPLMDLILQLSGNGYCNEVAYYEDENKKLHREKTKVYLKKPTFSAIACIALITGSIVISIILANTLYQYLYIVIIELLVSSGNNMSESDIQNVMQFLQ